MASKTPRFRFNFFGGPGSPGTIMDEEQKFTGGDRLLLDRLLTAVEKHDHRVRTITTAAPAAPTGILVPRAGQLISGVTYFYRFGLVDAQGVESLASGEVAVATPVPLPPPTLPSLTTDPALAGVGTLTAGYYYYATTALRGDEESAIGAAAMISVLDGEGAVQVTLPPKGEADSFSVWRMGSTDVGFTRIGTTAAATFVDTGAVPADPCACDPGVAPPQTNTGIASYAVTITLPAAVDLTGMRGWRLYRTTNAGIYESASLVHETVERTDEWDPTSPLLRSWTDTGRPLSIGQPMDTDQNMHFAALTFDSAATAPDVAGYPDYYPMVIGGVLMMKLGTQWVTIGGGGGEQGPLPAPIMTSPNGGRWALSVDDTGALVTTATNLPGPPARPTVTVA